MIIFLKNIKTMTDWIDLAPQRPRLWDLLGLIKKEKKKKII